MPNQFGPTFVESPVQPGVSLAYTPTLTQSATVTKTATYTHFIQFGSLVWGWVTLAVTGAGTTNNAVVMGLPVTAVSINQNLIGIGYINDASPATNYPCEIFLASTTTINFFRTDSGASGAWGVNPNLALASGDTIYAQFVYEAA